MSKLNQILLSLPGILASVLLIIFSINTINGSGNDKLLSNEIPIIVLGVLIHVSIFLILSYSIYFIITRGNITKKVVITTDAIIIGFIISNYLLR